MARRRRRGGRKGLIPKTAGGWVSLGFKVAGAVVALNPAIKGVADHIGDPASIPTAVGYNYTGIDFGNPGGGVNTGQLTVGVGSIVGGIVLAKAGSILGRMIH